MIPALAAAVKNTRTAMEKELIDKFSALTGKARSSETVSGINDISRVSEGTFVKGEISSSGDIRIDGKVEGQVVSQSRVVVGEAALIKGTLACNTLDLWGTIEGDVYVKDVMSLKSSAVVTGSLHVRKFQVEMGAQVNGTCKMIAEEEYDNFVSSLSGQ